MASAGRPAPQYAPALYAARVSEPSKPDSEPAAESSIAEPDSALEAAVAESVSALEAAAAELGWPDFEAENSTRELLERLDVPVSTLGRLQEMAVWLAGTQTRCPPAPLTRVRVVVFAADHGIGASVLPAPADAQRRQSTYQRTRALRTGHGVASVFAPAAGAGVRVVDVGVDDDETGADRIRRSSGRIDAGEALTADEVERAVALGARIADEEVDGGADLLIAASTGLAAEIVAAAVISVLTSTEPVKALGVESRLDDATWMRAMAVVRDAHRFGAESRYDAPALLSRIGGADLAALTGFLLRAAARRTPVLLDGPMVCAAALVARDVAPRAIRWWQAGSASPDHGHQLALADLQLDALLDLGLSFDEGVGSLLAVPLLNAAVHAVTDLGAAVPSPDV